MTKKRTWIKKLKEEKKQIQQELKNASDDEDKHKDLERRLSQVKAELNTKDNDGYRKQNSTYTNGWPGAFLNKPLKQRICEPLFQRLISYMLQCIIDCKQRFCIGLFSSGRIPTKS